LDAELVSAARQGDVASFARLYERHYAAMVGVARALLDDRDLAEDVAQETFAVACGSLGRLRRPQRFAPWLRGICRRIARNLLRRRRRAERALRGRGREPPASPAGPEADLAPLRRAVARLRPRAREVVMLHYFSGQTHRQIAELLRISPSAVHGRLVRARRQIAADLRRQRRTIE
jgi:RNA polymerase sigma-70 factor (ECF subfamily)